MSRQDISEGVTVGSTSELDVGLKLVERMPSPDLVAKIGIKKLAPFSLMARMPSPEVVAKVGIKGITPQSLVARMPSAEVAAKVGRDLSMQGQRRRVHRLNAA